MSVIVEKPYQFMPPHRGNGWPNWIQRLRLVDRYLRRKEGIVAYEGRHVDRLRDSLDQNHGIFLAPNHCRYADPLVIGWPARTLGRHVYAMASWHLFNKSRFESFAIQKMGGFSLYREGQDRQSLETAIEILATAERPLILFPEGTTNRSNDRLQPLLEGVSFIARTAARRRAKSGQGQVVIHPVGIKYVFVGDIHDWSDRALGKLEGRLGWRDSADQPILQRLEKVIEGLLSLQEIQYLGGVQMGSLRERRCRLIESFLQPLETQYGVPAENIPVSHRVRQLRTQLLPRLLEATDQPTRHELRRLLRKVELAQQLGSYVEDYLQEPPVTDTRVLETIQRIQENFLGKADSSRPLKVIVEFDEAITVPAEKAPRGVPDPILLTVEQRLKKMLGELQHEARLFDDPQC